MGHRCCANSMDGPWMLFRPAAGPQRWDINAVTRAAPPRLSAPGQARHSLDKRNRRGSVRTRSGRQAATLKPKAREYPRRPQHPRERPLDFLGQPRQRHVKRQSLRGRCACGPGPGPGGTAVAALDFAEPADQVHASAQRASVKIGNPLTAGLARGADQHLPIGPDPAQPRAAAAVRIDRPGAAPVTGHQPPVRGELRRARPAPSSSRRDRGPGGSR